MRKLSLELVPWHITDPQDNTESIRVQDLQFMVDTVLEEIENKEKVILHTLIRLLHFKAFWGLRNSCVKRSNSLRLLSHNG